MLPSANRGAGMNLCFPDVCLTPPAPGVPIPYLNVGPHAMAAPFSPTVLVCGLPALNLGSKITLTTGDEPGTLHPTIKGVGTFVAGTPNIFVDRIPAINLTCPTTGNRMNAPIGAHLVPNAVNTFYNLAGRSSDAAHAAHAADAALPAGDALLDIAAALAAAPPPSAALLPEGIGYLRVPVITADLPARATAELQRLEPAGLRAVLLDLRGCPGGDLDAALRLAEDFLPRGAHLATLVDADGDEVPWRARRDPAWTFPLVILVDAGTASAAEVLAAALRAHGRALLAGGRTFGKASVQSLVRAEGGFAFGTVARCVVPGATLADGVGLIPDLHVSGASAPSPDLDADAPLRAAWDLARFRAD
ncbi:MAG TPA: S41 family peptidase [Candidatus Nanopelagicales bacterium]|nr:S41 family peptidase [Candidatus Nanopelagicales bacterium]